MRSWSAAPALLSSTPRRWRRSGPLHLARKLRLLLAPFLLDQPLSLTTTRLVWLQWDAAILSNRRALLELEEELRKVVKGQESLEKKLQVGAEGGTQQPVIGERCGGMLTCDKGEPGAGAAGVPGGPPACVGVYTCVCVHVGAWLAQAAACV